MSVIGGLLGLVLLVVELVLVARVVLDWWGCWRRAAAPGSSVPGG